MARLIGPDESVRVVYQAGGLIKAQGYIATVYADAEGTQLADILTVGGTTVTDSQLTIDAYSKIPLFQFPDGADVVYCTVNGGPLVPLYARTDDRIDTLATAVTAVTSTANGAADKTLSNLTSASTARTNLGLGGAATLAVGTGSGTVAAGDDSRITGALQKAGGTLTGSVLLDSDGTGGTGSDSTRRITLETHQKATAPTHYGETLRIDLKANDAKGMIAWREDYTGSGPRSVAWIGAHGKSNDGLSWHNHISIEVPDETGALQSALEVPFAPWDEVDGFGIPAAEVYVRAIAQLVAAANLSVEGAAGSHRILSFGSTDGTNQGGKSAFRRWVVSADSTAEAGASAGSDFRIARCDDSGAGVDAPLFIKRSTGFVGIGTTNPAANVDVGEGTGTTSMRVNRGATTTFGSIVLASGSTDRWTIQMRNDSTEDLHLRNAAQGHTALLVENRATAPNISLLTATKSYGGGAGVIFVANASTVPTTNPSGGGVLFAEGGALKWRSSGGTVTTIAAA